MIETLTRSVNEFMDSSDDSTLDRCRSYFYDNNTEYYEDNIDDLFIELGEDIDEVKLVYNPASRMYHIHTDDKEIRFTLTKFTWILEGKHFRIESVNTADEDVDSVVDDLGETDYTILYFEDEKRSSILSQRI